MSDDLNIRLARAESDIAALQRQYDQLQKDVAELRNDIGELKAKLGDMQVETVQHFSELKDMMNSVLTKAFNSLPPWGAILTILLGALIGTVTGWLLR